MFLDRSRLTGAAVMLLVALAPHPAAAQHDMPGMQGSPALSFDDLGTHHRAISTASPDAQRYFDQGLRLVYAFNHDEAQRSFEQAAQLDTNCAICWWGAALTLGPNINLPALPDRAKAAYAAERRAVALAAHASPVEKALIQALDQRYTTPPPEDPVAQTRLDTDYANAMRGVARRFPKDDDVQALFAEAMMDLRPWNLWTLDGKPAPGTTEIVSTLEKVLARNPDHPGANHYYIHAVEGSPHPEKALPSAQRIARLTPGAGHIVHMPSHIYIRTGRYHESAAANREAIAADQAYVAKANPQGFYLMYVAHNHQFLWATAMMQGRSAEAIEASRACLDKVPLDMLRQMPGFDFVLNFPVQALTRFGRWDEVLAEPAPPGGFPFANAMWHFARGRAYAAKGELDRAKGERDSVVAVEKATDDKAIESLNSAKALLQIASLTLDGEISAHENRTDEAIRQLRSAVAKQDSLHYSEPPDWYYPVRHSLGAVLLAAARAPEAEAVYRADLARNPDNGWSLFGLTQSLEAQKKATEAVKARAQFEQAWKEADVKLAATDF